MRRHLSLVLIGLGAFLVVAALLMRFYAYPALAKAPVDQDSITSLSATDATLFDIATMGPITTDVNVEVRTVGDVEATEKAGDDILVWVSTTSVRSEDGTVRSRSTDYAAHDAVTGEAVNCCGEYRETTEGEKTEVQRKGQVFKFPFGTEKKDYAFWDSSAGQTFPATYAETDEIDGLEVYIFDMVVPDMVVGTRELPGSIFGSDEPAVDAEVHYSNTKSMAVEPNTGAIVDRTEAQKQSFVYDGTEVIATEMELSFTDKEVAEGVESVESDGPLLGNLKGLYSILAGVIGLLLIAGGVFMRVRQARTE